MKFFWNIMFGLMIIQLSSAQTPEQLKSFLPELEGWKIESQVEVFDSENLFNRINGSAPLFIENNFREMTSMEYTKGDDYVTIQAYRHASPQDAFGMYASERSTATDFLPIGGEAHGYDDALYFFAGDIYVKMSASKADAEIAKTLKAIGKGLAQNIDPKADYPAIIKLFPNEGKVLHSETYITSNYLGHTFLNGVYTATYDKDGKIFQVFVIDAQSKKGAKETLNNYFTFTKQTTDFSEGNLLVKDKYNGNIPCIWKSQYIIGIFNEAGANLNEESLLKELAEKL